MKNLLFFALIISIGLISCNKNEIIPKDYRNSVVGDYSGIEINTSWQDTIVTKDTTNIVITLSKSNIDNFIDFNFSTSNSPLDISFEFYEGQLMTNDYRFNVLEIKNDSLYIKFRPSRGPNWTEYFTEKNI